MPKQEVYRYIQLLVCSMTARMVEARDAWGRGCRGPRI